MSSYQKYLKYKSKYLELKKELSGGVEPYYYLINFKLLKEQIIE